MACDCRPKLRRCKWSITLTIRVPDTENPRSHFMKTEHKVESGLGWFHQWASEYEEFDTGAVNYPVAIVELDDGTVITPHATDIKFLDTEVPAKGGRVDYQAEVSK